VLEDRGEAGTGENCLLYEIMICIKFIHMMLHTPERLGVPHAVVLGVSSSNGGCFAPFCVGKAMFETRVLHVPCSCFPSN